jgi:hypothetical protein
MPDVDVRTMQDAGPRTLEKRQQIHHVILAHYLAGASLAELAHLTGALAVELGTVRGIPVADLIGGIQARIEAAREATQP